MDTRHQKIKIEGPLVKLVKLYALLSIEAIYILNPEA